MRYWIDFEFDGYHGNVLTMGIVNEFDRLMYVGFKDNIDSVSDQWVKDNVLPLVDKSPIPIQWKTTEEIQQDLLRSFKMDGNKDGVTIITDWPDDIQYLSNLLLTGPGTMIGPRQDIPRMTFKMERIDAYPSSIKEAVQHNAAWDAIALKYMYLAGESNRPPVFDINRVTDFYRPWFGKYNMPVEAILELECSSQAGEKMTIREYLGKLLLTLWEEKDGFHGKYPFGDSGWEHDLYRPLVLAGAIHGEVVPDGNAVYVQSFNRFDADACIADLINAVFKMSSDD